MLDDHDSQINQLACKDLQNFQALRWLSSKYSTNAMWSVKEILSKAGQSVWIFVLLGLVIAVLPVLVVLAWFLTVRHMEHTIDVVSVPNKDSFVELLSNIENTARSLVPINYSTVNLARVLSSSLNRNLPLWTTIDNQVAHFLFPIFSTVPHVSQISYIREDGLFFSYYREGNQTFALFANTSYTPCNNSTLYQWYCQPVNDDTGMRFGEAIDLKPVILTNSSWFNDALNSENGYFMWGLGWGKAEEPLFLGMASVKGFLPEGQWGIISLGIPVKVLTNIMSRIDLHGGVLYLATKNGQLLAQTELPNTSMVVKNDTVSMQLTKSDDGVVVYPQVNLSSMLDKCLDGPNNSSFASDANILEIRYKFYCAPLEIAGVKSIAIMAFPQKEFVGVVDGPRKITLVLLLLMLGCVFVLGFFFVLVIVRAMRREVFLCSELIKQMEATQQVERKSMNKSLAFARASHDVRTSLAAIVGLIDLCRLEASPQSELDSNLLQMNTCASNLLDILNSVLDTSKIEAGKVQLEEAEFDLVQIFEEVVNIFYIVAARKGVEVMLDPYDGSLLKASLVKGDCGRLKQVLCNLLSNAVKFTAEGHVVVRAWIKKSDLKRPILASDHRIHFLNCLLNLISKNNNACNGLESLQFQKSQDSIELVVEVDDTGKGIPKEKQKSIFENFVQVKEPAFGGYEGTGLGLGIVQSLVRLMGGEISIVDKEHGEKGTCFRFNIFLQICDNGGSTRNTDVGEGEEVKLIRGLIRSDSHSIYEFDANVQHHTLSTQNPLTIRTMTRGLSQDGIHAILMVQGDELRRITQRWMEQYGIKVWPLNRLKQLHVLLEKLEQKFESGRSYSSNSTSYNSNTDGEKEGYVSGVEHFSSPSMVKRDYRIQTSPKGWPSRILIIIEMSCAPFSETCSMLAKISRGGSGSRYKIVWIPNSNTSRNDLSVLKNKQVPCDLILQKPFHRSRLQALLRLFLEIGGTSEALPSIRMESLLQGTKTRPLTQPNHISSSAETSRSIHHMPRKIRVAENLDSDKPLSGMNIILAEDNPTLMKVGMVTLTHMGATVECCGDGEDVINLVTKALYESTDSYKRDHSNQERERVLKFFPYDIILMDCEMQKMDGYEATRQIRTEEQHYDIHIPIIALTAHVTSEEVNKAVEAGMDFHMVKPLKVDQLLDAIHKINHDN